jgi:hypothetical protein
LREPVFGADAIEGSETAGAAAFSASEDPVGALVSFASIDPVGALVSFVSVDPVGALVSFEFDRPKCLRTAFRLTDNAAAICRSERPAAANALIANALSIAS